MGKHRLLLHAPEEDERSLLDLGASSSVFIGKLDALGQSNQGLSSGQEVLQVF